MAPAVPACSLRRHVGGLFRFANAPVRTTEAADKMHNARWRPLSDNHRMARRADPGRTYHAGRAAIRSRLIDDGLLEVTADEWIARWEAHAAQEGIERDGRYWETGWIWISEQRAPKRDMGAESDDGQVYGG